MKNDVVTDEFGLEAWECVEKLTQTQNFGYSNFKDYLEKI